MNFNQIVELYRIDKISDGMGGQEEAEVMIKEVKVLATPTTAELSLKQYGIVSTTSLKIFTHDSLPEQFDFLKYANKKYQVLQLSDFGKIRMLLVEVIE